MKKVFKVFPAWAYDKEEKWLNEMSAMGWELQSYTAFQYHFTKSEPGKYQYGLELLPYWPGSEEEKKYLEFLEDSGIEMMDRYLLWGYFRKKNDGKPFVMFSDLDGRIAHVNRVIVLMFVVLVLLLYSFTSLVQIPLFSLSAVRVVFLVLFYIPSFLFAGGGFYALFSKRKDLQMERNIRE